MAFNERNEQPDPFKNIYLIPLGVGVIGVFLIVMGVLSAHRFSIAFFGMSVLGAMACGGAYYAHLGELKIHGARFRQESLPKPEPHIPNDIPVGVRIWRTFSAVFLIIYGAIGIAHDDVYIPGKRGPGMHLHGAAAGLVFAAMLVASAVLMAEVVDHYDRRNNEHHYRWISRLGTTLGWGLFVLSIVFGVSGIRRG